MGSKSDSTAFRLEDSAFICSCSSFATTATEGNLQAANFVTLMFTTQKNVLRGGKVRHKASGESLLWPNVDLLKLVLRLRTHGVPPSTPLSCVMTPIGWWKIYKPHHDLEDSQELYRFLRPNLVFEAKDVSARSLRANGSMTLLYLDVDSNISNMIGHWSSNKMLRYLHIQA